MLLAWVIAYISITGASGYPDKTGQDPNDPLIFGPGLRIGSRLQFGLNVVPADWNYSGKVSEPSTTDTKLKGFQIITLARPSPSTAKVDPDEFSEVPCDFLGSTPVITVFSQDGTRHKFTIDTGATRSYVRASLARELNFGREDPLPMCLYLPSDKWVHFKAEVDRSIAVLAAPSEDFPVDGILGMNAISCLQLNIDYRARKLRVRVSSKPLDEKLIALEIGSTSKTKEPAIVSPIPITRQDSGRYTVNLQFGTKSVPMELDTGASILGLLPSTIADLNLVKVGETQVLIESGLKILSKYVAKDLQIGAIAFLFPVVHEGVDPRVKYGGFGPSVLPHRQVIIDYPGLRLLSIKPTEDESVAQAIGQLISGTVRIQKDQALLDMPDPADKSKPAITKIQDRPIAAVIQDLRQVAKGDASARERLVSLYRSVNGPGGHFTVRQNENETKVKVGGVPDHDLLAEQQGAV